MTDAIKIVTMTPEIDDWQAPDASTWEVEEMQASKVIPDTLTNKDVVQKLLQGSGEQATTPYDFDTSFGDY